MQNIDLINKSRATWLTEILMLFLTFLGNLLQDAYFSKNVDNIEIVHKTCSIWFEVQFPLNAVTYYWSECEMLSGKVKTCQMLKPWFSLTRIIFLLAFTSWNTLRIHCTAITTWLKFFIKLVTRLDPHILHRKFLTVPLKLGEVLRHNLGQIVIRLFILDRREAFMWLLCNQ